MKNYEEIMKERLKTRRERLARVRRKPREKYNKRCVVYVTASQYEKLHETCMRRRVPMTQFWREALELKLSADELTGS